MRKAQPNFFLPLDRAGIDPFTQRFPVTLRLEGTVRGTGGIRIVDHTCATSVQGLYAAGDAATRQLICGGFTGGGSHNAAWAISSGSWAGKSAAEYAQKLGEWETQRSVQAVGEAGLTNGGKHQINTEELIKATQAEVFPYNRNYFRNEKGLTESLLVDPSYLRQGFGSQLFKHARVTASSLGLRRIVIQSDPNAEGFYVAHGARVIELIPSSIPGRILPLLELVLK